MSDERTFNRSGKTQDAVQHRFAVTIHGFGSALRPLRTGCRQVALCIHNQRNTPLDHQQFQGRGNDRSAPSAWWFRVSVVICSLGLISARMPLFTFVVFFRSFSCADRHQEDELVTSFGNKSIILSLLSCSPP